MLVELKDYAPMIGIVAGAVRKRISRAIHDNIPITDVLPAVKEAKKFGKTWVFTVDKKKLARLGK